MTSRNLIEQLLAEIWRVKRVLPFLDSLLRLEANRAIVFAEQHMAKNDTEGIRDSLVKLRLFRKAG
jgi:hypothetical protein